MNSTDYTKGIIDGIKMYAWYKDGVQYVGTTGTTLQEAIKAAEAEFGKKKPGISLKG